MESFFYLHYGPGGNSQIEQKWSRFPSSLFLWDQPECFLYEDLVKAVVEQIKAEMRGRVNLVAHSFGCNIAFSVTQYLAVDHLVLLSPFPSLPKAFQNFGSAILKKKNLSFEYQQRLQKLCSDFDVQNEEHFWRLVSAIAEYEQFQEMYWFNRQAFDQYLNLMSESKPLNYEVWKAVLSDYLSLKKQQFKPVPKVTLVLGAHDPYINLDEDIQYWEKHIPTATIKIVDSGHFPQFETNVLDTGVLT